VHKVTTYITSRAVALRPAAGVRAVKEDDEDSEAEEDKLQVLVISLKDAFYEKASGLVGVFRDCGTNSSGVLTLDLGRYREGGGTDGGAAAAGGK
jgi:hypothetical protein